MAPSDYSIAVGDYLRDCRRRGLRPDTLRYYGYVLDRVGRACGLAGVDDLTLAAVRGFQDEPGSLGPASMRGLLRALRTFTAWLVEEERLPRDPLARLRLPRVDERVRVVPTDGELVALLRASAPALRVVLAVLVATGLRIGDVAGLCVGDLRPGELVVGKTKNRAGRLVPLDPVLDALLDRHAAAGGLGPDGPLFATRLHRRLTGGSVRLALADARVRASLLLPVTPHVVRHWHARDLGAHGTTDRLLAARMGWRSPALVARYAPVAHHELAADVGRYAPLVRLRDEGWLDGLFPRPVLAPEAYASKKPWPRAGAIAPAVRRRS